MFVAICKSGNGKTGINEHNKGLVGCNHVATNKDAEVIYLFIIYLWVVAICGGGGSAFLHKLIISLTDFINMT